MKNLILLFLITILIACQEPAAEQSKDEQAEASTNQVEEVVSVEELEGQIKTGLTDYDKSKLVFQPAQVLPVDESKQNKSLRKVLDDLLIVINNKDVAGLKPFIIQDIEVDFGESNGFESFAAFWDLDLNPEKSMLWDVLKTTISLGGTFSEENKKLYSTPYIFTKFPYGDYDAFEFGVIIGEKVNIRATPNLKGQLVRQLTHEVVRMIAYDKPFDTRTQTIGSETHDWVKIEMADGETGYVWGKFFRSAIDYRAGFATVRDEGWKMIYFTAGD